MGQFCFTGKLCRGYFLGGRLISRTTVASPSIGSRGDCRREGPSPGALSAPDRFHGGQDCSASFGRAIRSAATGVDVIAPTAAPHLAIGSVTKTNPIRSASPHRLRLRPQVSNSGQQGEVPASGSSRVIKTLVLKAEASLERAIASFLCSSASLSLQRLTSLTKLTVRSAESRQVCSFVVRHHPIEFAALLFDS